MTIVTHLHLVVEAEWAAEFAAEVVEALEADEKAADAACIRRLCM